MGCRACGCRGQTCEDSSTDGFRARGRPRGPWTAWGPARKAAPGRRPTQMLFWRPLSSSLRAGASPAVDVSPLGQAGLGPCWRKETGPGLTVIEALILGVVQGTTEFLPISSSGHLVVVPELFGLSSPPLAFDVFVHLATLVAVLAYFHREVAKLVVCVVAPRRLGREERKYWRRLLAWLVIGSVPAALAGFLFNDFFEGLFAGTLAVGFFLLLTSALLWAADLVQSRVKRQGAGMEGLRAADVLLVGCFQALAIAPGLSRSGSTIAASMFLGFDRSTAAHFSFLLSIPAILGAFVFSLKDIGGAVGGGSGIAYLVGALAALVSGFLAVFLLMRYLKRHRLRLFAVYTLLLGLFVVVLSLV